MTGWIDLDPHLDVAYLQSIDAELEATVREVDREKEVADEVTTFYPSLPPFRLDKLSLRGNRVRTLYLRKPVGGPASYFNIGSARRTHSTRWWHRFGFLTRWIEDLPFAEIGRVLVIYDEDGHSEDVHRDNPLSRKRPEFIWFRTNLKKRFFLFDPEREEKDFVTSYCAWFDTRSEYHGYDPVPGTLVHSIRVDGVFEDGFRRIVFGDG